MHFSAQNFALKLNWCNALCHRESSRVIFTFRKKIGGHLLVLGNGDESPSNWYLSLELEVYELFPFIPDLFKASTFHITDFLSDFIL